MDNDKQFNDILTAEAQGLRNMIIRLCEYSAERDQAIEHLRQCLALAVMSDKKKNARIEE